VKAGKFEATTDESRMQEMDAVSIAVPTPLAKTRDPDMGYVIAAADAVGRNCRPGVVVVLESTTYPGTTRELLQPKLEAAGLTVGEDVFLAFSPERVDPGNPKWNTKNTPKIVGGITPACTEVAAALYATCLDTMVPVSSTETAELVKLLENTFRSANIGLVNGSRVLVLGVAYKKDIDDMRESPALDVIRLLEQQGADVHYHDPYVPKYREDGHEHASVALTDDEISSADAVVIVTDHSKVDY